MDIFIYQYQYEEETDGSSSKIVGYGLNTKNENCSFKITGFQPWCFIELDESKRFDWSNNVWIRKLLDKLNEEYMNGLDWRMKKGYLPQIRFPDFQFQKQKLEYKKKLYFARKIWNDDRQKYDDVLTPCLKVWFQTHLAMKSFFSVFSKKEFLKLDHNTKCQLKVHEGQNSVDPIFRFIAQQNIPSCGWVKMLNSNLVPQIEKRTCLKNEYEVYAENVVESECNVIIQPLVLGFDIECYSSMKGQFPDGSRPDDCIFNISVTLAKQGDLSNIKKYLFTLGNMDEDDENVSNMSNKNSDKMTLKDVGVFTFERNETALILAFRDFINTMQPNVIIGYNILSFDFKFIVQRAKFLLCEDSFSKMGFKINCKAAYQEFTWQSSATTSQTYIYYDIPGVIQIDLLPIIKKDFKLPNYKLDTVCKEFGLTGKHDLPAKEIFKCYESGVIKGDRKSLELVGKYCVNDSVITHQLYEKAQSWLSVSEMAKTANVPIMHTFLKGTQIQMYSQVIRHCLNNNMIIQTDAYTNPTEGFEGAIVLEPIAGLYDNILSFDFSSLYPSCIISHNLDYSTFASLDDKTILDDHCHVEQWTSNEIEHKFRFIKAEYSSAGVIPTLLQNHLAARKKTRKLIKVYEDKANEAAEGSSQKSDAILMTQLLDKSQLAYKICANCFTKDDHKILTNHGFFDLDQMIKHFQDHDQLGIGCYVEDRLEFHQITKDKLIVQTGIMDLIKFDHAEMNVSMNVTSNHRMWVKLNPEIAESKFQVVSAINLYNMQLKDPQLIVEFQTNFPTGINNFHDDIIKNQLMLSLSLNNEDQFNAFLILYGYWLTNGHLIPSKKLVSFNLTNRQVMMKLCQILKLKVVLYDYGSNDQFSKQAVYMSERNDPDNNLEHLIHINLDAYWILFSNEYGEKHENILIPKSIDSDYAITNKDGWFCGWCFQLSKKYVLQILAGLNTSSKDSLVNNVEQATICTLSLKFANEIQVLALNSGLSSKIDQFQTQFKQTKWCVHLSSSLINTNPNFKLQNHISKIANWTGTVFCVNVPVSPNLIMVQKKFTNKKNMVSYFNHIVGQSLYGALGVKKGYLPFMPVAMTTTKIGRSSIEFVAKFLKENYQGKVVYGDSVTRNTPLLVKDQNGQFDYTTIENLVDENWTSYHDTKQSSILKTPLEVWTEKGWTLIKKVIRHKTAKTIHRVVTNNGLVDVTEDHSLLSPDGHKTSISEIKIGSRLLHSQLPCNDDNNNSHDVQISNQTAHVWGIFFAKGCLSLSEKLCIIVNLENDQCDLVKQEFKDSSIDVKKDGSKFASIKNYQTINKVFYDQQMNKKVPKIILNGSIDVKKAFWQGFSNNKINYFNDQIGCAGFYYIAACLKKNLTICMENNFTSFYQVAIDDNLKSSMTKDSTNITHIINIGTQNDFVYDLETENHHFGAGIGSMIVHNTDSCHVKFEDVNSKTEAETKAEIITKDINQHFIKPMNLEYEKLYSKYFILSKKRYIACCKDDDGKIFSKIEKGVVSKRRDNCLFVRTLYQKSVDQIMENYDKNLIIENIVDTIIQMFQMQFKLPFFIISKTLNETYKTKPAHKILSDKMKDDRGQMVAAGTRIEYLFVNYKMEGKKVTQALKIEDVEYFKLWRQYIHLDFVYYLDKFVKPLDEVFELGLNEKSFMERFYKVHKQKALVNKRIRDLFSIKLVQIV